MGKRRIRSGTFEPFCRLNEIVGKVQNVVHQNTVSRVLHTGGRVQDETARGEPRSPRSRGPPEKARDPPSPIPGPPKNSPFCTEKSRPSRSSQKPPSSTNIEDIQTASDP